MAGFFSASAAALFAPFVLLVNSRPRATLSFPFGRSTLFVAFFNICAWFVSLCCCRMESKRVQISILNEMGTFPVKRISDLMETLAKRIEEEFGRKAGGRVHCAVYEDELQHI